MSTRFLLLHAVSFPNPCPPHFPTRRRSFAAPFSAEPIPKGRRRYGLDLGFDEGSENNKKRIWWSDSDVDAGELEYEDEDDEEEFGAAEEDFWGFKVLAAFGWMVPAVGISLLLGTGPNAFIMALVIPLGQRLISLAFDKAVGMAGDASKTRYRSTKSSRRPYPKRKAKTNSRTANPSERPENGSDGGRNGYKSWAAADASYRSVGGDEKSRYGGWDDLDNKSRASKVGADAPSNGSGRAFRQQRKSKSGNRVGRAKETPLLMRLLIAAFPFLGFWARLF